MESGQLDLAAKAAYLKELNKTDPAAVLRHMEQQPQLASEAVAAEYIRALVKSGRSRRFPLRPFSVYCFHLLSCPCF
jgi:hypothetical protein